MCKQTIYLQHQTPFDVENIFKWLFPFTPGNALDTESGLPRMCVKNSMVHRVDNQIKQTCGKV
jgi:hypothetical protein